VYAQKAEVVENLSRIWIQQAKSKEDFAYPRLMWHQINGNKGQWGWVKSNLIYERRGSETRKAVFVVNEKLSDTAAIVDVMITYYKPAYRSTSGNQGRPSQTTRTRRQFLFSGFDFDNTKEKQQLNYTGGVLFDGEHAENLRDGTQVNLPKLEPIELPPLPKHTAELGIGVSTWADHTGRFSVEASFVKLRNDQVTLVTNDGRRIEVPLDRLAANDQNRIRLLQEVAQRNRQRAQRTVTQSNRSAAARTRRKRSSFSQQMSAQARATAEHAIGRSLRATFGR
jgi:hypothetical protein